MMGMLSEAARLTVALSAYRDKQLWLTVDPDGIIVHGRYPGWKYDRMVSWKDLTRAPTTLEIVIRDINHALTERWRDAGAPKMVEKPE